jgi:HK97 family phage prohead protease
MTTTVTTEERRSLSLSATGAEVRADAAGVERFVGLASPFNTRASIGDPKTWGFFEEFAPGAYTKTLQEGDQRMLVDHDSRLVVSRVSAGSLELSQSPRGLAVDSALDQDLSYVRDLIANLRNRNITGMSIGFMVPSGKDTWSTLEVEEEGEDGKVRTYEADLRVIHEARLLEVSAVTFPAFEETEAALRFGVMPALTRRGDRAAIERRAAHRPELSELLRLLPEPALEPEPQPEARKPHLLSRSDVDRLAAAYATTVR